MRKHSYTSFSDVTRFLSKSCICVEYKEVLENEDENFEENLSEYNDFEEVFADHLLMGKRLRKTLYAGNFSDLEEPPDHPPIALTGLALELFSKAVPNNGLDVLDMDYVSCVSETTRISPCAMIVAMIYLERLQLKKSDYLEIVSPSGLFVVTMLVASKFLFEDEDDTVTNQMWSEALNFDVRELNNLERNFLSAIDWKVLVDSSDYFNYLLSIEKIIANQQSSLRNWLTYSDICTLAQDPSFEHFWITSFNKILKVIVLWTVGYAATTLTLHCAGIALHKLMLETKDIKAPTKISVEFNHAHNIIKPTYQSLNGFSDSTDKELLEYALPVETYTRDSLVFEKKTKAVPFYYNKYNSFDHLKTVLPSSLNKSKIFLMYQFLDDFDHYLSYELVAAYYHYPNIHCKQNLTLTHLMLY